MEIERVVFAGIALLLAPALALSGPKRADGTIAGKVSFQGVAPRMKAIDMSHEPSCAKQYATPPTTETVVSGSGNALENVLVYVSAGAPDDPAPSAPVVFNQKGCRYIPYILAFHVNQEIKIQNEDDTVHNVHPQPKINREWNRSQPPGAPPITESYEKPEIFPVKCNVHPWMRGIFAVLKNSHYAVTGDGGTFSLPNLAPGKYTITAYHEIYGEQSQQVTIAGGETTTINFVFKIKP